MLVTVNTTKTSGVNIERLVADFWATRPRRPRHGRMAAGVAAGIGRRYGIDPVIVRVALVVTAVYGSAGILLYLVGWLVLAQEDDEASAIEALIGRGTSSVSQGFTVLLCVLCLPTVFSVFDSPFGFLSGVLGLAALLAGLYLLHTNRAGLGVPAAPTTTTSGGAMSAPTVTMGAAPTDWDPLGAAPLGWDLPDPDAPPPVADLVPTEETTQALVVRPRRRSKVGGVTMALAFMTAAGLFIAHPHSAWLTWAHMAGIVAGVLACGLVVGAFARGGRGLIWPTIIVSAVAVLLTTSPGHGNNGIGDIRATPVDKLAPTYSTSFGDVRLDLRQLKWSKDVPVQTTVSVDAGQARVTVPSDVNVEATCSSQAGDVRCLGRHSGGGNVSVQVDDTVPNAVGTVKLNVQSGAGSVVVERG